MSNELDKHFGEHLHGYESELDAEALWQAVQPPRRRRRWWWLLLLLLGVAGSAYWWTTTDPTEHIAQAASTAELEEPQSPVVETSPVDEARTVAPAGEELKKALAGKTTVAEIATHNRRQDEVAVAGATNPQSTLAQAKRSDTETTTAVATAPDSAAAFNAVESGSEVIAKSISLREQTRMIPTVEQVVELPQVLTLPVDALPVDIGFLSSTVRKLDKSPEWPIVPRKQAYRGLFLGLEGAYFASDRNLSMNDSMAASGWLRNRQRTETVLDASSSQLTIGYQHRSGWRVRSGLAFTQLTNVFEWSTSQMTTDSVEGVQQIIIDPSGDSTLIRGQIARYQTSTYFKRTYNRMQQWELPLLVGYRLQQGNWSLVLEGGPRFLLQRTWSGDILDVDANISAWEEALDYRSSVSLQGIDVAAQIVYRLGPHIDLGIGLAGRIPLQDFGVDNAVQQERYRLLGGQLGVYYRW